MELHAMAYFIAQSLDSSDELHKQLFTTIMGLQGDKNLDNHKKSLASVFEKYGLAEKDFYETIYSSDMENRVKGAIALMKQAKVNGTPTMMINGKYIVLNNSVKSYEDILSITDFLITKELTSGF